MTTEAMIFSKQIKRFLKKRVHWSILCLCILFIGSASMSLGSQPAGNTQSEYAAFTGDGTDLSPGPVSSASATEPEKAESPAISHPPRPYRANAGRKVTASWYGRGHENKLTASGERFETEKDTLAHRTLPLGTRVRLFNPANGKSAEGIVNDRGPYIEGRDVDVSYGMAKKLGFLKKGVMRLRMETM